MSTPATPPFPLFHYTTRAGLIGIVGNRTLRATDILHLNDASEFTYAVGLCKAVLVDEFELATQDKLLPAVEAFAKGVTWDLDSAVFVTSFSEHDDQLSQWRAYAGTGGACIGFHFASLKEPVTKEPFKLVQCVYDEHAQKDMMRALLKRAAAEVDPDASQQLLKVLLVQEAPAIKHPAFHEEAEWRLVSDALSVKDPRIEYRDGVSTIIPFWTIGLGDYPLPISFVRIGPTPDPDLAWLAARRYLREKIDGLNEFFPIDAKKSAIPYRSW
ncbi:MAG: DUF2971 domain-containing protein [Thermoanaerobaculia bacterium]